MVEQQPGQIINPNNQSTDQPVATQSQPQLTPTEQVTQQSPAPIPPPATAASQNTPPQAQYMVQPQQQASQSQDGGLQSQVPPVQSEDNVPETSFTASGFGASQGATESFPQEDYSQSLEQIEPITWTASEYIGHQKNSSWFLVFALAVAIAATGVYFLTKDILSAVVIVVVGIVFGMYAGRKPQEQTYTINNVGVVIGQKMYSFDRFKSFSVAQEGPFTSIVFMPLGRFMPMISIYYDPKDEDRIANTLSAYLPFENYRRDPVDTLMRKIRF